MILLSQKIPTFQFVVLCILDEKISEKWGANKKHPTHQFFLPHGIFLFQLVLR